ncbi:hypothetical protein LZ30DRAFT_715392 [Colletotrichum cereale]|nr:hypothetical protein LZ30DRAFT_715392 [Colletotrichum cereale]
MEPTRWTPRSSSANRVWCGVAFDGVRAQEGGRHYVRSFFVQSRWSLFLIFPLVHGGRVRIISSPVVSCSTLTLSRCLYPFVFFFLFEFFWVLLRRKPMRAVRNCFLRPTWRIAVRFAARSRRASPMMAITRERGNSRADGEPCSRRVTATTL